MKISPKQSFLNSTIVLLALISFFTDIASEMLFPIMPIYLISIGYSPLQLGFLEAGSELILTFFKGFFGYLADKTGKFNLFIKLGYGISAFAKPLIGISTSSLFIWTGRLSDRFAKAIRTAPRDSLLSNNSTNSNRGSVFGFHRALDTLGATIGPIITVVLLFWVLNNQTNQISNYSTIFLLALIPGLIAFSLTFFLPKIEISTKQIPSSKLKILGNIKGFWNFYKRTNKEYKFLIFGLFLTALLSGSDMFLILRLQEMGISTQYILILYVIYHLATTLIALPVGMLCDKFGYRNLCILSLMIFSLVAFLLSQNLDFNSTVFTIVGYGIMPVITEVIAKAWITINLSAHEQSTGLGLGMSFQSLGSVIASIIFGVLWQSQGGAGVFNLLSIASLVCIIYFGSFLKNQKATNYQNISLGCNPNH